MNNTYKKIAVFIILLTIAGIIWHERLSTVNRVNVDITQENPFTDTRAVPLKLDSLEMPFIDAGQNKRLQENDTAWDRDPFILNESK